MSIESIQYWLVATYFYKKIAHKSEASNFYVVTEGHGLHVPSEEAEPEGGEDKERAEKKISRAKSFGTF